MNWRRQFIKREALAMLFSGGLWRPLAAAALIGLAMSAGMRAAASGLLEAAAALLAPVLEESGGTVSGIYGSGTVGSGAYSAASLAADIAAVLLTAPLAEGAYTFAVKWAESNTTVFATEFAPAFASIFAPYSSPESVLRSFCLAFSQIWRAAVIALPVFAGIWGIPALYKLAAPFGTAFAAVTAVSAVTVAAVAAVCGFILSMDAKIAYYIAAREPGMTAGQAVGASRAAMRGHKREAARFYAGFLPLIAVWPFFGGLPSVFFSAQYMLAADILFSQYIFRGHPAQAESPRLLRENLIIGADILNGK